MSSIDLPLSAEMYVAIVDTQKNLDKQKEEGKAFVDHEIVETYPDDKGVVKFMLIPAFGSFVPLVHSNSKTNRLVRHVGCYPCPEKCLALIKTRGSRRPCESDQRTTFQHEYP